MKLENLYDTLSFVPKQNENFEIIGDFSCEIEQNTLYKAYSALNEYLHTSIVEDFMKEHAIKVEKNIPAFAGLGGGSSDAATYLKMCNEVLALGLSLEELAKIGLKVGADVPFFVYGYDSANVSGVGEVVERFDEELLQIETYTPKLEISTPKVYKSYRENFFAPISEQKAKELAKMPSTQILNTMMPKEANDLFAPALKEYEELEKFYKKGYHFSGSGSSFFRVKESEK